MAGMKAHCDIFCRVIDNLGDIGVCWRLAKQLTSEHGWPTRLWVDDLTPFPALVPGIDPDLDDQCHDGVNLRRWPSTFPEVEIPDVVIEAFACDLPSAYLDRMASRQVRPFWINLEYLSAEPWVEGCHGLASPHPTLPLCKHFFFPGFTKQTGGLLRERGLLDCQERQLPQGVTFEAPQNALKISLFCYDSAPVDQLLKAWIDGTDLVVCYVPPGKPRQAVEGCAGRKGPWSQGRLTLVPMGFVPQADFDALLRGFDVNFVRGEDSFVRAQWAESPFVWQIYPQEDSAHQDKLDAFLDCYTRDALPNIQRAITDMHQAWNTGANVGAAWNNFRHFLPEIRAHNHRWVTYLAEMPDLATNLVKFVSDKL